MESDTKFGNTRNAPAFVFPDIDLKPEILDDDFDIDNFQLSKNYLQDFQNLDQFPFNRDIVLQPNCFDPVDPFSDDSCVDFGFGLYENASINATTQYFEAGGFLNFPDRKDSSLEIETALTYHDTKPSDFVFPDESSCVTADNIGCGEQNDSKKSKNIVKGNNRNNRDSASVKNCVTGQKKYRSAKGQWTIDEDRLLKHLVEKYGERKWSTIAQMLKGRIGKQCRERWHNHLRPDIKKDIWTEDEDRILIEIHAQVGNKWAEIAKSLPGRTENSIKNHWNATKRRQLSRRTCRTKWPKPSSLLQNYIKSLNFDRKSSSIESTTAGPGILYVNTPVSAQENHQEIKFRPEYEFDDVPDFAFNDDHLFKDNIMELPLDITPFMHL